MPRKLDQLEAVAKHIETHDQGASGSQMSPEPDHREVTFNDLTADGQRSFSMAWTFFRIGRKLPSFSFVFLFLPFLPHVSIFCLRVAYIANGDSPDGLPQIVISAFSTTDW